MRIEVKVNQGLDTVYTFVPESNGDRTHLDEFLLARVQRVVDCADELKEVQLTDSDLEFVSHPIDILARIREDAVTKAIPVFMESLENILGKWETLSSHIATRSLDYYEGFDEANKLILEDLKELENVLKKESN